MAPSSSASSAIHASGCYTTTAIRKGARVANNTGPLLTRGRGRRCLQHSAHHYLFGLGRRLVVIDGNARRCTSTTVCDPPTARPSRKAAACGSRLSEDSPRRGITLRLLLYDGDEDGAVSAIGGAASCRGTNVSGKEVKRRAKAAAKKAGRRKGRGKDPKNREQR